MISVFVGIIYYSVKRDLVNLVLNIILMRKISVALFLIHLAFSVFAQEINIIPQPVELKNGNGFFTITNKTQIAFDTKTEKAARFLRSYLERYFAISCPFIPATKANNAILLVTEKVEKAGGYNLKVDKNAVSITGDETGVFNGIQTLIQLLPTSKDKSQPLNKLTIAQLTINDYPRFAYRGMHLDCSRHFWSVDFIKTYIDYLVLHKFNTFHWHLTDDQGWRIEIKKYPKLTSVAAWRNGTIIGRYPGTGNDGIKYGGFYTQEQIKEIVKYATDRYITVVPEIEMPGHASAAIAAYPELSCFANEPTIKYFPKQCKWNGDSTGKQVQQTWGVFDDVFCAGQENTFTFLQNVIDEVLALFPSKYIHVGGDECPKENWKRCPNCQKKIKDNNLKDEHELQSYFIQRMEKYLNNKGRTLIGWDEILEGGLAPNAVVMSWRGVQGGIDAAKQNHDVIMTPGNPVYFDHTQSDNEDSVTIGGYNPIEKVYDYEPIPKELNIEQAKHVLGAQANMWTEYMKNTNKVEYMLFPRISALSEVLWSQNEKKNWNDFQRRLITQFKRYDLWNTNYSKAYFDLKGAIIPANDYKGVLWKLESKLKIPISINFNRADSIWFYAKPQLVTKNTEAYATMNIGSRSVGIQQVFHFNKATGKKIILTYPASEKYPGDGAFTLVNGVQNEKGFSRSREFIGFDGKDCEAVIDLGSSQSINSVTVNCLDRKSSWIWQPLSAEAFGSIDGQTWSVVKTTDAFIDSKNGTGKGKMIIPFNFTNARYIKVVIKNHGIIPVGNPGAGNKPWLFVDEIEVN
jgi:hexosaminidase